MKQDRSPLIADAVRVTRVAVPAGTATLSGVLFRPEYTPRAAVVLHGATGVPQGYYRAFATFLAEQGFACLTYDYRGFGASSADCGPDVTMADWGLADQPAAQAVLESLVPGVPVWVIGHSLGGMMVPFHSGADRIERLIAVASGPVHLRDHPLRAQWGVRSFWYGPPAWATYMLGYLPGRILGRADLPAGVYWQWRRWCTTHGFYLTDIGRSLPMPDWNALQGKAKFVAISDDGHVPPPAVWRLMQHYPEAMKSQLMLRPEDYGLKSIGHISAFAARNSVLWPQIIA